MAKKAKSRKAAPKAPKARARKTAPKVNGEAPKGQEDAGLDAKSIREAHQRIESEAGGK